MREKLELSEFIFSVGMAEAGKSFFDKIKSSEETTGEKLDDHLFYRILHSDGKEGLYGIEIRIGENSKYSSEVIDSNDFKIKKNPKNRDMVEPDTQILLFFQYDRGAKENRMWTNRSMYNNKIREIFSQKSCLDKNGIMIARVFVDPSTFVEELAKINDVVFSARPDTVFENKDLTKELDSLIGFGGAKQYKVEAKFENCHPVSAVIKEKLLNLVGKKEDCGIDSLVIVGKDSDDNNMILNKDCVTNKISLNVNPDEDGFYRFEDVKDEMEKFIEKKR